MIQERDSIVLVQLNTCSFSISISLLTDDGYGTFLWASGHKYQGEFAERKRHGYGVQVWPDGSKYEGHFSDDLRHGTGRHSWPNEEVKYYNSIWNFLISCTN